MGIEPDSGWFCQPANGFAARGEPQFQPSR
ncbi:hypothetical protein P378_13995 [Desulforamulus profundi]|uniref:Uncharacterized protein n=1 Tax=Desulforamulus profundi TaxID=1383067 RepID=A0A2C6MEN4_9FIRM|nr:hypothetical protein P378_13995 [Desulforamulus profundi]